VDERTPVPAPQPPGPIPGAALGVAAGLLIAAVWAFGAWDVALALTLVFSSLVMAITLGAPGWRRFGVAMAGAAVVIGGALVLVFG
jgi:hypothetical protein